jgi:hypothetical protein
MVDDCFKFLRKSMRNKGRNIIQHIKRNHFDPLNIAGEGEICIFCGSGENLTKEHVIPKWSFQNDPSRSFITRINNSEQSFIKTAIPACSTCNNNVLSKIEKYIKTLLLDTDLENHYFEYEDSLNIIRWLELIEYKFHVLEFRRKFRAQKASQYVPVLRDIPISIMRYSIEMSPYAALAQLRLSQSRIKRKEKDSRYYSMIIYKTKNEQPHFFHAMDKFIYFEFPEYGMALFYFFNEEFSSNYDAADKAKQIISDYYG